MKKFIKIFLIFLCLVASLGIFNSDKILEHASKISTTQSVLQKTTSPHLSSIKHETTIATTNFQRNEISSLSIIKKDTNNSFSTFKSTVQNKLLQYFLVTKFSQSKWQISKKISLCLKNEILTRAP